MIETPVREVYYTTRRDEAATSWRHRSAVPMTVALGALFALALGLRIYRIKQAFDIFIDEVTYTAIASNIANGHGVTLYGDPFTLHPPAGFLPQALAFLVHGKHSDVLSQIYIGRYITALAGALTCVLVCVALRRVTSFAIAYAAGLYLALDPFVISFDSRVMLEAEAQVVAIGAIACLAVAAFAPTMRRYRTASIGAGLLGAVLVNVKETFGLTFVGMLILVMLFAASPKLRRSVRICLATTAVGYAVGMGILILLSGFDVWWNTKVEAFERLIGTYQITGFNAETTHVSLTSRVVANLENYASSYVVLAVGGLCTLGLCWRAIRTGGLRWRAAHGIPYESPESDMTVVFALWGFTTCGYLVYATGFGSIEEQMFYIPMLPCVVAIALIVAQKLAFLGRFGRAVLVFAVAVAMVADLSVWTRVHTERDDRYARFLTWQQTNLPVGARVSVTEYVAQFMMTGVVLDDAHTLEQVKKNHSDYILLVTNLVEQGYGQGSPAFLRYLEKNAKVAYRADGRTEGSLLLFDVRAITGGSK